MSEEKQMTLKEWILKEIGFSPDAWNHVIAHTIPESRLLEQYAILDVDKTEGVFDFYIWTKDSVFYPFINDIERKRTLLAFPRNPPKIV